MYQPSVAANAADVIVLAGDIWKHEGGIAWARATWPSHQIIYVAGNHEFYGRNRLEVLSRLRIAARECNVDFLDNDELIIDDTRFLGATLWTDFRLFGDDLRRECMVEAINGLNDFRVIHEGSRHFTPMDSVVLHEQSVKWLQEKLDTPFDGQTVVVTHHLPSWESVTPEYRDSKLSACFASRLDHMIDGEKVQLWIHGHTHSNLDYEFNGTHVMCNPRGYVTFDRGIENADFNPHLVVDVTANGCEIVTSPVAVTSAEMPLMSARARDAAIWAIEHLQVRTYVDAHEDIHFVDLSALKPALLTHVRDIVLTHDMLLHSLPEHLAIAPLETSEIDWLVDELIKRAVPTARAPKRKNARKEVAEPVQAIGVDDVIFSGYDKLIVVKRNKP